MRGRYRGLAPASIASRLPNRRVAEKRGKFVKPLPHCPPGCDPEMVSQQEVVSWSEFLPQEWHRRRDSWTAWQEMLPQQPERPVQELLPEEGHAPVLLTQQGRR